MPNWCSNTLTIGHSDPAMIKRVEDAVTKGELLNEFVPVPEDLKITAGTMTEDEKVQAAKNREKYGYENWYDYCVNEWGTKWDVDAEVLMATDTAIDLQFESAWSPPIGWYEKMVDLGFTIDAYYYEPGVGYCGHWYDGCDELYEIGATSDETRDTVPQDIDEMFGISESQYEYEQENRDELQAWIEDAVEAKKEGA